MAPTPRLKRSACLALTVTAAAAAGQPLFAFCFTGRSTDPLRMAPGVNWLGGDFDAEYWHVPSVIGHHSDAAGWSRCSRDLMAVGMTRSDPPESDPAVLIESVYTELIERLRQAGYPELLRIWNYLPAINAGQGHSERYRRFCLGRGRALSAAGLDDSRMCAATAIGTADDRFRLVALAARSAGRSFENPRQVSAWRYPDEYGPRSPAFARATALNLEDGRPALLISGTASVVGHATAHRGNVLAQTDEAARNVDILLEEAAQRTGQPHLSKLDAASLVRVYVRHAADWPMVEARLRQRWPGVALAGLRGDICRRDLLVEVEAWHSDR
ncbi:MAG: hypothetical protein HND55_00415 [Pseudomonadota bacterium]|nr:MAG: hypothetical protein HND55_00415 [Pseudomonadota bacterium]